MKLLKVKFVFLILIFQVFTAGYTDDNYNEDSDDDTDDFDANSDDSDDDTDDFDANSDDTDDFDANSDGFDDDSISDECNGTSDSCPSKSRMNKLQGKCTICGIAYGGSISRKILNGTSVRPVYKYPWIVPLIRDDKLMCGGTLISANFVLTAGHCVFKEAYKSHPRCAGTRIHRSCYISPNSIKVGLLRTHQRSPSKTLSVSRIISHPLYSYSLHINDVAILQLVKPVRCSKHTIPVCLPPKDFHRIGRSLITAGYGYNTPEGTVGPQVLREGVVKEIDPQQCVLVEKQPKKVTENIICAAGMESGQSSCFGDSGSGVFRRYRKKFYAVGTVSTGKFAVCSGSNPVTYMKIYAYLNFIKQHVKDLPSS